MHTRLERILGISKTLEVLEVPEPLAEAGGAWAGRLATPEPEELQARFPMA